LIYFLKTFPEIRFCIIHVHETIRFLPLRKRTVVIGLKNGEMATDKKKTHNNSLWIRQEKWIRTEGAVVVVIVWCAAICAIGAYHH
jgi:hypothetical protein